MNQFNAMFPGFLAFFYFVINDSLSYITKRCSCANGWMSLAQLGGAACVFAPLSLGSTDYSFGNNLTTYKELYHCKQKFKKLVSLPPLRNSLVAPLINKAIFLVPQSNLKRIWFNCLMNSWLQNGIGLHLKGEYYYKN